MALVPWILAAGVFWWFRISYWSTNAELPFSDMADFERIAHGIIDDFDFRFDSFWQSYKSPGLPVVGAVVFAAFGKGNYLAWQCVQSSIIFLGVVLLGREISLRAGAAWVGSAVLLIVGLSQPSIFWSLKFATEGICEGFFYLSVALWLMAVRRKQVIPGFLAGLAAGILCITRPNCVTVPFIAAGLTFLMWREPWLLRLRLIAFLGVGVALIWAPWVARTYYLYGTPVLSNTSGGFSLFFDLGTVTLENQDGTRETRSNNDLLAEAPTRFENDYVAHLHAKKFFWAFVQEDPHRYLRLVLHRIRDGLTQHSVWLTKLPRGDIFGGRKRFLVVDKSPWLLAIGFSGLVIMALLVDVLLIILPLGVLGIWLPTTLVALTSRYLDPMLPVLFIGVLGWGLLGWRYFKVSAYPPSAA